MTREEVANVCKAMSDANRLRIIEMLTTGEKCGCDLLEELQVTQPTLSHHMKVLSDCGLVSSRKDGKWQHWFTILPTLPFLYYFSSLLLIPAPKDWAG